MTLTMADIRAVSADDGRIGPRADRPRRRAFTAEYKAAILAEYDAIAEPGARGVLLRREGLYSSHVTEWRRARDAGALAGLTPAQRAIRRSPEQAEIERLRSRAERAEAELAKTKACLLYTSDAADDLLCVDLGGR